MKKIILYFLGICCMLSSAVGFMKYGVGNGIACIVIGLILLSCARSSGSDSVAASPAPESSVPETQKTKSIEFPIAGVTFENESGKLRSGNHSRCCRPDTGT